MLVRCLTHPKPILAMPCWWRTNTDTPWSLRRTLHRYHTVHTSMLCPNTYKWLLESAKHISALSSVPPQFSYTLGKPAKIQDGNYVLIYVVVWMTKSPVTTYPKAMLFWRGQSRAGQSYQSTQWMSLIASVSCMTISYLTPAVIPAGRPSENSATSTLIIRWTEQIKSVCIHWTERIVQYVYKHWLCDISQRQHLNRAMYWWHCWLSFSFGKLSPTFFFLSFLPTVNWFSTGLRPGS